MKAHELLATPDKWTKGILASNSFGEPVHPRGSEAVCWCLLGAINHCYINTDDNHRCRNALSDRVGLISKFNDASQRTHAEVLALLKELDI